LLRPAKEFPLPIVYLFSEVRKVNPAAHHFRKWYIKFVFENSSAEWKLLAGSGEVLQPLSATLTFA